MYYAGIDYHKCHSIAMARWTWAYTKRRRQMHFAI